MAANGDECSMLVGVELQIDQAAWDRGRVKPKWERSQTSTLQGQTGNSSTGGDMQFNVLNPNPLLLPPDILCSKCQLFKPETIQNPKTLNPQ